MPDHYHEVTLPTGEKVTTGPEIELASEAPAATAEGAAVEGYPKRAPGSKAVAEEAMALHAAYFARLPDALPPEAKAIYDRMHSSSIRHAAMSTGRTGGSVGDEKAAAADPEVQAYATALAWRAVGQAFGFQDVKRADPPPGREWPPAPAADRAKSFIPGTADESGAMYVVPVVAKGFRDASRFYDRIEQRRIPGARGVMVRVGSVLPAKTRMALIDVRVPKALVTDAMAAVNWVRENWRSVLLTAELQVLPPPYGEKRAGACSAGLDGVTVCKFVTTPEQATQRISYGEVYVPYEVDLQGQFATAKEVEKMAYEFAKRGGRVGFMHGAWAMPDGSPIGHPVETFIARKGDGHFVEGAWVMGVQWHPQVWPEIVAGKIRGFSIGGEWGARQIVLRHAARSAA